MNNFYRFDGAYKRSAIKIQARVKYNTLKLLSENSELFKNPFFYIDGGTKKFDIIQFSDSSCFAISEKVKNLLEENSIKGWSCFLIYVDGIDEKYYAFQNLSEAGHITNLEAVNNYETENRIFNIDSWDGSEIFHLKDTLLNVCTEEVKVIFEKAKISNLEILPL